MATRAHCQVPLLPAGTAAQLQGHGDSEAILVQLVSVRRCQAWIMVVPSAAPLGLDKHGERNSYCALGLGEEGLRHAFFYLRSWFPAFS